LFRDLYQRTTLRDLVGEMASTGGGELIRLASLVPRKRSDEPVIFEATDRPIQRARADRATREVLDLESNPVAVHRFCRQRGQHQQLHVSHAHRLLRQT
jgi:hypothetical protein